MTTHICPTCFQPLYVHQQRPDKGGKWRARCVNVDLHPRRTNILGHGQTANEAVAVFLARVERNNKAAVQREKNAARAAGKMTDADVRESKRKALAKQAARERQEVTTGAMCPACHVPLRTYTDGKRDATGALTGEVSWYAVCPRYGSTKDCGWRHSRIQGATPEEAAAKWLDDGNRKGVDKPAARPGTGKWAHVGSVDNFPRCHCGSRILDGGKDCGGYHPTIHDMIRSGKEAPGVINLR